MHTNQYNILIQTAVSDKCEIHLAALYDLSINRYQEEISLLFMAFNSTSLGNRFNVRTSSFKTNATIIPLYMSSHFSFQKKKIWNLFSITFFFNVIHFYLLISCKEITF